MDGWIDHGWIEMLARARYVLTVTVSLTGDRNLWEIELYVLLYSTVIT